ncbi:MAG: hypothetical protein Kow0037_19090 [Calditrichia bacterium]
MKRYLQLLLIGILFLSGSVLAENKYAGAFLELGIGGRAMALGGSYVSLANDASAFYWNPAGAATLLRQEAMGMYASIFQSLSKHNYIGFTKPLKGNTAVSFNWIRLSVADIPHYALDRDKYELGYSKRVNDESTTAETWQDLKRLNTVFTDDPLGYSSFVNDAFFLTLAKNYKVDVDFGWQYFVLPVQIPVGLNLKFIRQSLFDKSASGIGLDLGTMLKFGLGDLFDDSRLGKFSFGFALKDVWKTKITWDTDSRQSERIERSLFLGASYLQPIVRIRGQLLFSYAFENRYDYVHHMGIEYVYYERLAVRFGLNDQQFTAGLGIRFLFFSFDYAYQGHELGSSHRISTSVRF